MVMRGGAVGMANPALQLVMVVAMLLTSSARAISPTDWMQSGQTGTNKAAWTRCSLATLMMAGTVSLTTRITLGW